MKRTSIVIQSGSHLGSITYMLGDLRHVINSISELQFFFLINENNSIHLLRFLEVLSIILIM